MNSIFNSTFQKSLDDNNYNDLVFRAEEEDNMLDYINGDNPTNKENSGNQDFNFSESDIFSSDPQTELEPSMIDSSDDLEKTLIQMKELEGMSEAYLDKFDRAMMSLVRESAEDVSSAMKDALNGKDSPIDTPPGTIALNDDSPESAIQDDIEDDLEDYGIEHDVERDLTKGEEKEGIKLAEVLGNDSDSDDDIIDDIESED